MIVFFKLQTGKIFKIKTFGSENLGTVYTNCLFFRLSCVFSLKKLTKSKIRTNKATVFKTSFFFNLLKMESMCSDLLQCANIRGDTVCRPKTVHRLESHIFI